MGFAIRAYDEGGCACERCQPWGCNGYLKLSRDLTDLGRSFFPKLRTVLSTWLFDTPPEGEWQGLTDALTKGERWVDNILADSHEDFPRYPLEVGVPGQLPLLNFPEISMWGNWPWGGFGANPLPSRFQRLWDQVKHVVQGGFPYSEGIYEDLNKAVEVQFYWDPNRTARATLEEYIAYEFGSGVKEEVLLREYKVPQDINVFYTLGFVTMVAYIAQALTGFFLLVYYIPHSDHAFRSVQDIMTTVPYGWLFRKMQAVGSNLMVAAVMLHMVSVFFMGGYKKPREMTWIAGSFLLFTTLAFCLSGYLLPWSQLSYWATTIVTTISTAFPYAGEYAARINARRRRGLGCDAQPVFCAACYASPLPGVWLKPYPQEQGGPSRGPHDTELAGGGGDGVTFTLDRIKFNPNGTCSAGAITSITAEDEPMLSDSAPMV